MQTIMISKCLLSIHLMKAHPSSSHHTYHHQIIDELKTTEQVTAEAYQWPGSLPVRFAHDPKLVLPSHNYYTGEQVQCITTR